jgi:SAM-dependent methyltransferase
MTRHVGYEAAKAWEVRKTSGFWSRYLAEKGVVLDIGYRGAISDALPIIIGAIGVELDYPGYDGFKLPFTDGSVGAVHASHVLEHVTPGKAYLREWFRVLRTGGFLVLMVPHAFLYERRLTVPPSRWSPEHLRSYTPASLLAEIETALRPNTWRLRHMADNDTGYDYKLPPAVHPTGCLEIECVIEKIEPPAWSVEP